MIQSWKKGLCLLCMWCLSAVCSATLIDVPNDTGTITGALHLISGAGDTVLVHPGIYPERLIFPSHDVVLMSEYELTGDSSAIINTIIDASDFADEDTSSVLTFFGGNSPATIVTGFTLRGGHGWRRPQEMTAWGGGIFCFQSHPTIRHNIITDCESYWHVGFCLEESHAYIGYNVFKDNRTGVGLGQIGYNRENDQEAIFEWNEIFGTELIDGSPNTEVVDPGVNITQAFAQARYNYFHDYSGSQLLGIEFYMVDGDIVGNRFERINSDRFGYVIITNGRFTEILDNVVKDCSFPEGSALMVVPMNEFQFRVEGNRFDNVLNYGPGAGAMFVRNPDLTILNNVFVNCMGASAGAIQFSSDSPGCQAVIAGNQFFQNRRNSLSQGQLNGSVLTAIGFGALCEVRDNWFEGNIGTAVYQDVVGAGDWDLSDNYWGDPSGPYHATLNPNGAGDTLSERVTFTPWLESPPEMEAAETPHRSAAAFNWSLTPAFPNPFNSTTSIVLSSQRTSGFNVDVYNTLGQRVKRLWEGIAALDQPIRLTWDGLSADGEQAAAGIYFIVAAPKEAFSGKPRISKALLVR